MKNLGRRLAALLLAVLMPATVAVGVFAESLNPYNGRSYDTYLLLGDSVAEGFGLDNFDRSKRMSRVEGTYGAYVADAVHAKTYYPYAQDGFRSAEFRMLLDPTYDGDDITKTEIPDVSGGYADVDKLKAERGLYQDAVKKADLITLDVGFNALWLPIVYATDQGLAVAVEYPKALLSWEKAFEENYGALVKRILELNPDVTLVLVGSYNPCKHWSLPPYTPIYVGQLLNVFFDQMNDYKKSLAEQYGGRVKFADVHETEVITDRNHIIMIGFDPHPTEDGHRYMANQILSVIG